jgi:hypothetical protein
VVSSSTKQIPINHHPNAIFRVDQILRSVAHIGTKSQSLVVLANIIQQENGLHSPMAFDSRTGVAPADHVAMED